MKKRIKTLAAMLLILFLVACENTTKEYYYYYNGNTYTTEWQYGNIKRSWGVMTSDCQWEEITVTAECGEEKGEKIKGDTQATFIRMHELYCARKDFELPTIEKDKNDITHIDMWFFDKTITISDKRKIDDMAKIIVKADNNRQKSNDDSYEYVGNIHVFFKDLPVPFLAGRIMQNKNEKFFFSSSINQSVKADFDGMVREWYSVPINIDF